MAGELVMTRQTSVNGAGMTVGGGASQSIACDNINTFQKIIPSATVNGRFKMSITLADVKGFAISASKACTVKTNSTSVPDDTIMLAAGVGKSWFTGDPAGARLITADVTDIYVTPVNAGEAPLLKIQIGSDATPVLGE